VGMAAAVRMSSPCPSQCITMAFNPMTADTIARTVTARLASMPTNYSAVKCEMIQLFLLL